MGGSARLAVATRFAIPLALASGQAAGAIPANRCVVLRNTVAAQMLGCLAKEEIRETVGRSTGFVKCRRKFARFAAAVEKRAHGDCPSGPTAARLAQRIEDTAATVFTA